MPNCNHPTCQGECRREKKQKKVYHLKRTPIKKNKSYRIPKKSAKRKQQDKIYAPASRKLRQERPFCELKIPGVCTNWSQGAHHPDGRIGDNYTNVERLMSACNACNSWVEAHPKEAQEMGLKTSKFKKDAGTKTQDGKTMETGDN